MKEKAVEGFRIAIEWGRPGTCPPDGMPRILAEKFFITHGSCPCAPKEWKNIAPFGSGYHLTISYVGPPPRQFSNETLSKIRKNRLVRRMEKRFPLFSQVFIHEEMMKKEDYYKGITDPEIQNLKDQAMAEWDELYSNLLKFGEVV